MDMEVTSYRTLDHSGVLNGGRHKLLPVTPRQQPRQSAHRDARKPLRAPDAHLTRAACGIPSESDEVLPRKASEKRCEAFPVLDHRDAHWRAARGLFRPARPKNQAKKTGSRMSSSP